MKQTVCSDLRIRRPAAGRIAALLLLTFILFCAGPSDSSADGYPKGKHDENLETWSFHSKLELPDNAGALYLGMFFCSGSIYFLNGNFAHLFWLNTATGEYTYENNLYIPPFEKVVHSQKNLNEKYHSSFFRYDAAENTILTCADFENIRTQMVFMPQKKTLDFDQVRPSGTEKKTFDWYMFPRMAVDATLNGGYEICASGQGHFQHFWGDRANDTGDFIVVHLDSGYDIVINDMQLSDEAPAVLSEEYMLISDPAGRVEKISSFKYSVSEWAKTGTKGKKYPVHLSVTSEERKLRLEIKALKNNQTANLLGVEKWFGYADITGEIDDAPQIGWAFFSPIGVKAK